MAFRITRMVKVAVMAGACLALAACLIVPGRFASTLDLRRDGRFSFAYTGELRVLALSKMAGMTAPKPFEAQCSDEDGKERKCTAAEAAEQKKTWDEEQVAALEKQKKDAEQMKALLGGIDPSSPQAAEELAARLRRQAGWKSVIYKGDGLFAVDYALSGRLDHDFAFPTIERFPMVTPFVQLTRRNDGTVRVDTPGFAAGAGGANPLTAMMSGALGGGDKESPATRSDMDGTFAVTTDGQILANNTDEGPRPEPSGQRLSWAVNARSPAAPTALVKLGN